MCLSAGLTRVQGFGSGDYKVSSSGTNGLTEHFKQEADGSPKSADRSLLVQPTVMQPHHGTDYACVCVCGPVLHTVSGVD